MKKKWANQLISIMLVPSLLSGPGFPVGQFRFAWPSRDQNIVTTVSDTEVDTTEPNPDDVTVPVEPMPGELAIVSVERSSDSWRPSAAYTITLGGDLRNVLEVTLTDSNAQTQLLESSGDGVYSVTIDQNGQYTITVTQNEGEPITAEMDNVMLSSITVYLNGTVVKKWENIGAYSGEWKFDVPAGLEQSVRIVVTDMTGNVLDTDSESFAPGYSFNRTITVSTNAFLRLYANRPLFIGIVTGASILMVGGMILIILLIKKRKNKNKV